MKFSHIADCHLGGWRIPALQQLNMESFRLAIDISIKEKVDFVLIAGDLFDSAYPSIEILKETFSELRKLKEKDTPCFIIAGSHDYSASGKSFLDVLEKAGFCKNVFIFEERDGKIVLNPTIYKNIAIYGVPGKKSGMEVEMINRIKLQEAPGFFKILMLHTALRSAIGNLPIEAVSEENLPKADYYALGHLHIDFENGNGRMIYGGPTFPNNFEELEELKRGSFYIVESEPFSKKKVELKIKETEVIDLELTNALTAQDKIIQEIEKRTIENKIILLRLSGKLEKGKTSDINFDEIEKYAERKGAFTVIRSTSKLTNKEDDEIGRGIEITDMEKIEETIIKKFSEENNSKFNLYISSLLHSLEMDKQDGETSATFTERIYSDVKKVLTLT